MAEPAPKPESPARMTVDAFLSWNDGTDTRYELFEGEPVAMNPPGRGHGRMVLNIGAALMKRMKPPCEAIVEAGVRIAERDDVFFQADLAVTCAPMKPGDYWVEEPLLIIEVLSPSTTNWDRGQKGHDYRRIPSIREIVMISSQTMEAEILSRLDEDWRLSEVSGPDAALRLSSIEAEIPFAEIYDGVAFEPEEEAARA